MTVKINADTSDGLKFVSDTSGIVEIQNNGTTVITSQQPAFRAYQSSAQSIANTTFTIILFDREVFDTASCYDTSNSRFTPNVAGYYYIKGMVRYTGTSDGKVLVSRIYKNGSNDTSFEGSSSSSQSSTQTSTILHLNGSSDYVEFYSYHNYGSSTDTGVFGSATVIFQGAYLRS